MDSECGRRLFWAATGSVAGARYWPARGHSAAFRAPLRFLPHARRHRRRCPWTL